MEKQKPHILQVRMSSQQYEQFQKSFSASSDTTMAAHIRKLILREPVKVFYRDRAFDDFTAAAIRFRKDAAFVLERTEWNEAEKVRMSDQLTHMEQLHIKIHEHVRKNKKNEKRP